MIKKKIEIINRIVAEAIDTGGDAGGAYGATSDELENALWDWLKEEKIDEDYDLKVIDVELPLKPNPFGFESKLLRSIQIVEK